MQKPIRYYITKSGDEPTVRSVKVARGVQSHVADADSSVSPASEPIAATGHGATPAATVKRRVKDAIRGRSSRHESS